HEDRCRQRGRRESGDGQTNPRSPDPPARLEDEVRRREGVGRDEGADDDGGEDPPLRGPEDGDRQGAADERNGRRDEHPARHRADARDEAQREPRLREEEGDDHRGQRDRQGRGAVYASRDLEDEQLAEREEHEGNVPSQRVVTADGGDHGPDEDEREQGLHQDRQGPEEIRHTDDHALSLPPGAPYPRNRSRRAWAQLLHVTSRRAPRPGPMAPPLSPTRSNRCCPTTRVGGVEEPLDAPAGIIRTSLRQADMTKPRRSPGL